MTTRESPFIGKSRHTLTSYLALFRAGKIGPLKYADALVPIVPCRCCGEHRPDDGTACKSCGVYKHCYNHLAAGPTTVVTVATKLRRPRNHKKINPRRKKKHV
jgi:hypothetical protein